MRQSLDLLSSESVPVIGLDRSSFNLYLGLLRPFIVPTRYGKKVSIGNLVRQSLGMINRDDRVVSGSKYVHWSSEVFHGLHIVPLITKQQPDWKKWVMSGSHIGQGIKGNHKHDFVWWNFLLSKGAGRTGADRFTQHTNRGVWICRS